MSEIRENILLRTRIIDALQKARVYSRMLNVVFEEIDEDEESKQELASYLQELESISRYLKGFK